MNYSDTSWKETKHPMKCSLYSPILENLFNPVVELVECSVSLGNIADPVRKAYVSWRMLSRIACERFLSQLFLVALGRKA